MFAKAISLASVCGALALVGCAGGKMTGSDTTGAVSPMALGPGCHAAKNKCVIEVTQDISQACGFAFNPDLLKVKKTFKNFVVVWRLPRGYEFRTDPAVGDGVKFPKEPPGDEFQDGYGTDNDDGDPASIGIVIKHRYRWRYVNAVDLQTYNYLVQFHAKDGKKPIVCDPAISNDPGQ